MMGPDARELLIKDMSFANKDVQARIRNALQDAGIHTLAQLLEHTEQDLLGISRFGNVCLAELTVKLKSMGLSLRQPNTW